MTDAELQAIREREAKATPGPWTDGECGGDRWIETHETAPDHGTTSLADMDAIKDNDNAANDAAFISHARTDIPALLAEVDRLRSLVQRLHSLAWRYGARDDLPEI